jgi:hypothetical protein
VRRLDQLPGDAPKPPNVLLDVMFWWLVARAFLWVFVPWVLLLSTTWVWFVLLIPFGFFRAMWIIAGYASERTIEEHYYETRDLPLDEGAEEPWSK